ncbi:hypothetical protein LMG7974_00607 [Campylobacter majalis]|uniref:Uncharacterized protein n=1 Tax=Campylobacter majalis TaxID=2790656 RepID=A0ABN7K7U6_9BACT|nr:hypothetical protein [Campylobacter majalis]CAD7287726.1 hypothetical protein LMG7974_00607 [Campylobacter majalis]
MYTVNLRHQDSGFCQNFCHKTKPKALKKYKNLLARHLCGYGIIWENINQKEHIEILSKKSLKELESINQEANFNNEMDYKITIKYIKKDAK